MRSYARGSELCAFRVDVPGSGWRKRPSFPSYNEIEERRHCERSMKSRIRYVDYYSQGDISSAWVKAALIGHSVREHIEGQAGLSQGDRKILKDGAILQPLLERAFTASGSGNTSLPVEAIRAVIEDPLIAADHADRADELVWAASQSVNAALAQMARHISEFTPLHRDGFVPRWKLAKGLLPFTETSLTTPVAVRECWCGCWVRDGDTICPCCGWAAPRGRASRAWERQQIQFQQLGQPGQPNVPAVIAAPGVLPNIVQQGLSFGFRVTSKTTLLEDEQLELDEPEPDDEFAARAIEFDEEHENV